MSAISFKTKLVKINDWTILHVPENASKEFPSRGMVMVAGTINGHEFQTTLEPDGKGSHWFQVDENMLKAMAAEAGDTVNVEMESTKEWVEPIVPKDLKDAVEAIPQVQALWTDITPSARWEWIRWIRATNNPDTRKKRIEVSLSKMKKGMRRPCCFNRNACTEPYVSKNWVLLEPTN